MKKTPAGPGKRNGRLIGRVSLLCYDLRRCRKSAKGRMAMKSKDLKKRSEEILKTYEEDPAKAELEMKLLQLEVMNETAQALDEIGAKLNVLTAVIH